MVYGIIKLINFAHGDIYMVGAYVAFNDNKLSFFPALCCYGCSSYRRGSY